MNLTIITPCSRPENLVKMANTIPEGVRWIVVFDMEPLPLIMAVIPSNCEYYFLKNHSMGYPQSNIGIEMVKDGYLYFLDDDTFLHPNLIQTMESILKYGTFDFIHFDQTGPSWEHRIGGVVKKGAIDKGSFIVSRQLVGTTRFHMPHHSDGDFAVECYKKSKNPLYIHKYLSIYNALRPEHPDIPKFK